MSDKTDNLSERVENSIHDEFPDVAVVINETPSEEGQGTLLVTVYGVTPNNRKKIRTLINDLDWEFARASDTALIPRLVSVEDMETFYPEVAANLLERKIKELSTYVVSQAHYELTSIRFVLQADGLNRSEADVPANQELALAA
jgi:hypothetical protein